LTEKFTNLAGIVIAGEDPPRASHRISRHASDRDRYGLPVLEFHDHYNTIAMRDHAVTISKRNYGSLGALEIWAGEGRSIGCHNIGVARMSNNPDDGVTNRWGPAHDIPNLFITDGSTFSASSAANPTLTIAALAIREANHMADRMRQKML
jgi:choline dehydrogenase-like flavoprotein